MWKITTCGFTLHEVLVMAAMNVASALIATDKSERTIGTAPSTEIQQALGEMSWQRWLSFTYRKTFGKRWGRRLSRDSEK